MSVKYYCDLCAKEVGSALELTTLSIEKLDLERSLALKSKSGNTPDGWTKEICSDCRSTLVDMVNNSLNWPMVKY